MDTAGRVSKFGVLWEEASSFRTALTMLAAVRKKLTSLDLDEIFSYSTTKEVRMLDRRLGMLCWFIRLIVFVYVAFYVFIYCEGYTSTEKGVGHVVSATNGTSYSMYNGVARTWDSVDAVQPALEDGAAFISTQVAATPNPRPVKRRRDK